MFDTEELFEIGNRKINFKKFDFSTVYTPIDQYQDSEIVLKNLIEILHDIYSECKNIRSLLLSNNKIVSNSIDSLKSQINNLLSFNSINKTIKSFLLYTEELFSNLLDISSTLLISDIYGNYLSSIIRFYLRREMNTSSIVYDSVLKKCQIRVAQCLRYQTLYK